MDGDLTSAWTIAIAAGLLGTALLLVSRWRRDRVTLLVAGSVALMLLGAVVYVATREPQEWRGYPFF